MFAKLKNLLKHGSFCSDAEMLARIEFQREFPAERIAWTMITAKEADRIVIGVFYGVTRPPQYRFYAVAKHGASASIVECDEAYRPKNWR